MTTNQLVAHARGLRVDVATGAAAGGITFGFYLLGAGRNYDYDSSQTVGTFVATRSLLDPFRRQTVFNNHPVLSFLDHLVYSAGGHSPTALRVLPIVFGAFAVALVAGWATHCWGPLAGGCAGLLLAANPAFAFYSRAVRGYSLVTLSAVASTILLARLLRRDGRWASIGYVFAAAAGLATHLYALFPLAAQAAAVCARGAFDRRWAARFAAALVLGGFAYVRIGVAMVEAVHRQTHHFRPHFPLALGRTILGGTSLAIVAIGVLTVVGFATLRRRETIAAAVVLAVAIAAVWLWLQPNDLYPRFLVWLVAAVAVVAGAAVGRWPVTAVLAATAVVALVLVDVPHWTQNPIPDRQAAQLVAEVRARGKHPCVLPWVRGSLLAYTRAPREVTLARNLARCDFVVGILTDSRALRLAARRQLPYAWILSAQTSYLVYSRLPRSALVHRRA
jgi:uncharacterized membrane protein